MKTYPDSKPFQTDKVLLIAFSHLIHDMYGAFLAPLLPLLITKLQFSYTLAGFLPSLLSLPSLINPLIGALADRVRWSYFVILAPAVTAIMMSALGIAPSYTVVAILLGIAGISTACYHVPAPVLMRHVAGSQIGKGMSFFMFGGELARMLGPLTIVGALSLWGLEGTYKLIPFGLLASLFLYLKLRNVHPQSHVPSDHQQSINLLQILRKFLPLFLSLAGITLALAGMRRAMMTFLPSYLIATKGYSVASAGIALSVMQGGGAVGTLLTGMLSDKLGRKFVLLLIVIVSPLLMWVFLLDPGAFTLPVLAVLGVFLLSTGPVLLAIVQETNSAYPAYINGIYMMLNFVIGALMSVVIGAFSDRFGFDWTFRLSIFWFLGSIPCLFTLPGKLRLPKSFRK